MKDLGARVAAIGAVVGVASVASPALAGRTIQASCQLTVEGRTYLRGRCPVYIELDGTFTLNTGQPHHRVGWFAFVNVAPDGTATASWNAEKGVDHADADLGQVTRQGACWVNARARICSTR